MFNRMLKSVGLNREADTYTTNILHCQPPGNRAPLSGEMAICGDIVLGEIQILQPTLIFAIGNIASEFLLNRKGYITKDCGQVMYSQKINKLCDDRPVVIVPVLHPAFIMRRQQENAEDGAALKLQVGEALRVGLRAIRFPGLKERT